MSSKTSPVSTSVCLVYAVSRGVLSIPRQGSRDDNCTPMESTFTPPPGGVMSLKLPRMHQPRRASTPPKTSSLAQEAPQSRSKLRCGIPLRS